MGDDEPAFRTAAELREEDPAPSTFDIPARPTRRFPAGGGLEYEGGTVFEFNPQSEQSDDHLVTLVESVLADETYRYGDWFDLPMPLYLVHDRGTGDTFRVGVRAGTVELHVLPQTGSAGVSAFYERLVAASECEWHVECQVAADSDRGA